MPLFYHTHPRLSIPIFFAFLLYFIIIYFFLFFFFYLAKNLRQGASFFEKKLPLRASFLFF